MKKTKIEIIIPYAKEEKMPKDYRYNELQLTINEDDSINIQRHYGNTSARHGAERYALCP